MQVQIICVTNFQKWFELSNKCEQTQVCWLPWDGMCFLDFLFAAPLTLKVSDIKERNWCEIEAKLKQTKSLESSRISICLKKNWRSHRKCCTSKRSTIFIESLTKYSVLLALATPHNVHTLSRWIDAYNRYVSLDRQYDFWCVVRATEHAKWIGEQRTNKKKKNVLKERKSEYHLDVTIYKLILDN